MLLEEGMLLLKGWHDDSRSLRVKLETSELRIVATCSVYKIEGTHVAFHVSGSDYFECSLTGCSFAFGDAKDSAKELPIGRMAESAVLAVRSDFKLLIVLLEDEHAE